MFDYKGSRMVVQSILPGIMQTSQSGARLMLGALEVGYRLKVKNISFATFVERFPLNEGV